MRRCLATRSRWKKRDANRENGGKASRNFVVEIVSSGGHQKNSDGAQAGHEYVAHPSIVVIAHGDLYTLVPKENSSESQCKRQREPHHPHSLAQGKIRKHQWILGGCLLIHKNLRSFSSRTSVTVRASSVSASLQLLLKPITTFIVQGASNHIYSSRFSYKTPDVAVKCVGANPCFHLRYGWADARY